MEIRKLKWYEIVILAVLIALCVFFILGNWRVRCILAVSLIIFLALVWLRKKKK